MIDSVTYWSMPITKSAEKALRQSVKRRALNLKKKNKYKATVKEFRQAIAKKDFDKAKALLPKVYKSLDKAAKTNVIKANKSSRLKSQLSLSLSKNTSK